MSNYFIRLFTSTLLVVSSHAQKHVRRRADALDDLNLGRGELHLPGAGGQDHVVSCRRTFSEDGGWHGECDDGLDANFVQRQDATTGKAVTFGSFHVAGNQLCRIAPDAEGNASIQCTSEEDLESDEEVDLDLADDYDDDDEEDEATHQRKLESLNLTFAMDHVDMSSPDRRRLYDDSGATLDLLVVWTPLAECVNSGMKEGCALTAQTEANMRGLIDLAMVETNVAFSLSAIRTKLRLVHAYRDDSYSEPTESSRYRTMLTHLTRVGDGELEGVHVKRALYGADLVHMIAGSGGNCGLAHVGPKKSKAFSISRSSCATGYYSFGHEIAHTVRFQCKSPNQWSHLFSVQLGAHHDRPSLKRCDSHPDSYNFGYRDPEAQFRTILAYGCRMNQCDMLPKNGCQRVQRFSNGVTSFNGKKLGNSANNNARVINQNSQWVAKWFPAMDCLADSECDDGNASTFDTCNVEKRICVFTPATDAMESLVIDAVDDKNWKLVNFKHTYKRPVVACTVKYHKDDMIPVVVRMTAVTNRSFKVFLQNPRYLGSAGRQVHCLVVEEGVWKLPDGRKLEAKRIMSNRTDNSASWVGTKQTYRHKYAEDPVVLGQVMTYNDSKWSTFWTRGKNRWVPPNPLDFYVGLHVGGDPNRERRSEEIGYICIERGRAEIGPGITLETDRSSVKPMGYVDGKWEAPFKVPFAQAPAATIATQAGMYGGDGSWVLLTSDATSTGFGIAMDEDQVSDSERQHAAEFVNYVAVSSLSPIQLLRS